MDDVCPRDRNLLGSVGGDNNVKIFDKRMLRIAQTFDNSHRGNIF